MGLAVENESVEKPDIRVFVTDHAFERGRERMGLKRSAMTRMAHKVWESGLRRKETTGKLRDYLDFVHSKGDYAAHTHEIAYGQFVWVWSRKVLLTILVLPPEVRAR